MDGTCALLLMKEETAGWEILFTPMQELIAYQCELAGISSVICGTMEQWKQGAFREALKEHRHVFVVETNRPYLTADDIGQTFRAYQNSGKTTALLEDQTQKAATAGWYLTTALDEMSDPAEAPAFVAVAKLDQVNTRRQLAKASEFFRREVIEKHLDAGVNIPLDHGVMIGPMVSIGRDTTVLPGTIIKGKTVIGKSCEIGPNTQLTEMIVEDGCKVISSMAAHSVVRENASIGPMSNIRFGCDIGSSAKVGDFVELKNAKIGSKTSVAHLCYLGDCTVGSGCNFGCGATIVNYDGTNKHHTTIGDDTFIGCNCSMVAPLTIGNRVYAAAGSTVTEDVPDDALVIARARQTIKPGWAKDRGLFRKQ